MINPVLRVTEMTGTDQEYIEGCLDGRADEFRHLVARYERPVFAYLRGRLRLPDRAQEAAQESFVRAFFNLAKLKKRDSFFPWLLGIARHVAREIDRHEQTDRRLSGEYAEQRRRLTEVRTRSRDEVLETAVSSLPAPLGTVTKRLSRAYARIRTQIEN